MERSKKRNLTKKTLAIVLSMVLVVAFASTAVAAGTTPIGISYKDDTVFKADKGVDVSIDVMDADIRDILSLFANKLDVNIVYLGNSYTTSFSISGVDVTTAFEIFMKSTGISGPALSYVRDGDLLLVGSASALTANFNDMMVFTKFNLNYMSANDLQTYLSQLGVYVNGVIVNNSTDTIFVQGMPYE